MNGYQTIHVGSRKKKEKYFFPFYKSIHSYLLIFSVQYFLKYNRNEYKERMKHSYVYNKRTKILVTQ